MIKLETSKMIKAIERAKAVRPRVTVISADARVYSVTGSKGDAYTVRFAVANGLKLAECDCKAGKSDQMCFHVAAAARVQAYPRRSRSLMDLCSFLDPLAFAFISVSFPD